MGSLMASPRVFTPFPRRVLRSLLMVSVKFRAKSLFHRREAGPDIWDHPADVLPFGAQAGDQASVGSMWESGHDGRKPLNPRDPFLNHWGQPFISIGPRAYKPSNVPPPSAVIHGQGGIVEDLAYVRFGG